jgi:hypothetical protein
VAGLFQPQGPPCSTLKMTRCPIALLQCSIVAFDGLLPEPHNQIVMTMLFCLAQWHALAKLQVHTGSTLDMLRNITSELGRELCKFHDKTCASYFSQQSGGSTMARVMLGYRFYPTVMIRVAMDTSLV